MINSREKGKRGERMLRDVFRAHGYTARRGQQFSGSPDSPDVICEELTKWLHIECKVGNVNMTDAIVQATADARGKSWVVCHKPNNKPWRFVMGEELFFKLLGGKVAADMPSSVAGALCSLWLDGDTILQRIREDLERGLLKEARAHLNFVDELVSYNADGSVCPRCGKESDMPFHTCCESRPNHTKP